MNILSIWTTENWRWTPSLSSILYKSPYRPASSLLIPQKDHFISWRPAQDEPFPSWDTKGWEHRCHPEKPKREPLNKKIFKWLPSLHLLSAGRRKFMTQTVHKNICVMKEKNATTRFVPFWYILWGKKRWRKHRGREKCLRYKTEEFTLFPFLSCAHYSA